MTKPELAVRQAIHKINKATALDEESDELLMEAVADLREVLAEHPMDYDQGFVDGVEEGRRQIIEQVEQEPVKMMNSVGNTEAFLPMQQTAGFDIPLYAAPVRTKDLTDEEILKITDSLIDARAVIAADREKNK